MTMTFRASSNVTAGNSSGGNLTINKPTGVADGDLILSLVYWESDTNAIATIPTGFVSLKRIVNTGAFMLELFYKWASGEPANYTWGDTTAGSQWRTIISCCYSGGTGSGNPLDLAGAGDQGDSKIDGQQTATSITTTQANDTVIYAYGNFNGFDPTGMAGFCTNRRAQLGGVMIADAVKTTAAATGTTNETGTGTADYAAVHVGLLASTGGGATKAPPPFQQRWVRWTARRP